MGLRPRGVAGVQGTFGDTLSPGAGCPVQVVFDIHPCGHPCMCVHGPVPPYVQDLAFPTHFCAGRGSLASLTLP